MFHSMEFQPLEKFNSILFQEKVYTEFVKWRVARKKKSSFAHNNLVLNFNIYISDRKLVHSF